MSTVAALFRAAIGTIRASYLENFVPRCDQWPLTPKPNRVCHRSIAVQQPEKEIPDVKVFPTPDRARRRYPITD